MIDRRRKKTIAVVIDYMKIGGAEKALLNMLNAFDYSRFDVTVWVRKAEGPWMPRINENCLVREWGIDRDYQMILREQLSHGKLLWCVKSVLCRTLSRLFVRDCYRNYYFFLHSLPKPTNRRYDCVISFYGMFLEQLLVTAECFSGKKKIAWIHSGCNHKTSDITFLAYQKGFQKMDKVYCVSEKAKSLFLECYPEAGEKTEVLYNLIDVNELRSMAKDHSGLSPAPTDGRSLILSTVGRLSKEKGQTMIPTIARMLKDQGCPVLWYIVGDGPEKEHIIEEIKRLDMTQNVMLMGECLNPYPFIDACDFYVQTSFREAYCLATLEAKALKKIVVTTNAPGMSEQFVNGVDGCITEEMTPESISRTILTLTRDRALIDKIKKNLDAEKLDNEEELQKLYSFLYQE